MKVRTDFVTNSSSSSFIAVFGKATNKDLAEKSAKENDLKECLYTGLELLDEWYKIKRVHTCTDWCFVDPFPNKEDIKEDGLYFIYSDSEEVSTDEWGEVNEEEVDEHYDSISNMINKVEGFDFRIDIGSGRDG